MKTLTCTTPGTFEYSETEKPELQKDQAIIKIKRKRHFRNELK